MTTAYPPTTACRVCRGTDLEFVFSLGDQFVSDFVPYDRVRKVPSCRIDIDFCHGCKSAQQRYAVPAEKLYGGRYWYTSGTTATMRRALAVLADDARTAADLGPYDTVLDIGSNDGTLLRAYGCSTLNKIGVEPATNFADSGAAGVTTLVRAFWGDDACYAAVLAACRGVRPKVVTAAGMFYDMDDPHPFVRDVAKIMHPDGLFVAQLMCAKQTVANRDLGNFCHEHLVFYSMLSLSHLFDTHGLKIVRVEENGVNGGSYRVSARHKAFPQETTDASHAVADEVRLGLHDPETYRNLFAGFCRTRDECRAFVLNAFAFGRPVYAYGASTKGNLLLQWYGLDDLYLAGAADRNPEKHGLYTAGTGLPIRSEKDVRAADPAPAYMLVLPYAFLPEFQAREAKEDWRLRGGKFVVPLPEFKVV
ncbi:MAG: methyltransferase domain-containing protein [Fimbriiglobus sp.]